MGLFGAKESLDLMSVNVPMMAVSLEACRCIGACGLAPVIMINDVYGRLADDIEGMVKYKNIGIKE